MGCDCTKFKNFKHSPEKGVLREATCIDCGIGKLKILVGGHPKVFKEDEING